MEVDHLNINPRILNAIRIAKIKLNDYDKILGSSVSDLERETKLKPTDIEVLQRALSASVYGTQYPTALECLNRPTSRVTTGCNVLDKFLRGGLFAHGITEVSGESGSGKTQLCLQLSLCVQLPSERGGLDSGAAYLCTEGSFSDKRLYQMIRNRPQLFSQKFSDKVYIQHIADKDSLVDCVENRLPVLLRTGRIKLIIIDSVAALFRVGGMSETVDRTQKLAKLSKVLHSLSWKYGAIVICVNQVTGNISGQPGNDLVPSLGLSWANSVTTRLIMVRTRQEVPIHQEDLAGRVMDRLTVVVRRMEVAFSPYLAKSGSRFIIDPEGVKGID